MAKGVQFNKGTLESTRSDVTWKIPTSEVHCVSVNELDYLRETKHFAAPLSSIERIDDQLQFTWTLPEGYQPIESVNTQSTWYKLKTAKYFLEIAKYFEENENLKTVYDMKNFFVDQHYNVKVIFYSNPIHLPYQSNKNDNLESIKKILARILTSINEKKLDAVDTKETERKDKRSVLIKSIMQSDSIDDLIHLVDVEYDHYLSLQDQRQMVEDTKRRKKQNRSLLMFSGIVVAMLCVWYFNSGIGDKTNEISELEAEAKTKQEALEEENEKYQSQLASYDAYFNGEIDKAFEAASEIEDNPTGLNKVFYSEVLVRNGEIDEALEQFPEMTNLIAEQVVRFKEKELVLEIESDDPYFKFEQALLKEEDEEVAEIIPELKSPTERQKQLIFDFYLRTNRDEALTYAKENDNITWEVKVLETQKKSLENKVEKLDKDDDKDEIKKVEKEIGEVSKELESLNEKL